jgi:hypothetical protein
LNERERGFPATLQVGHDIRGVMLVCIPGTSGQQ